MEYAGVRMTIAVYNLTKNTQLSIRGTTKSHPDSEFVFGIYMEGECLRDDPLGGIFSRPDHAYEDMDWEDAVKMAQWILEQDKWIKRTEGE